MKLSLPLKALLVLQILFSSSLMAQQVVQIDGTEAGDKTTGANLIWHDPNGVSHIEDALKALSEKQFNPLNTKGSSGLQPGAFWSYFQLHNVTQQKQTVHLEYVDHQLIGIEAFVSPSLQDFQSLGKLAMEAPFSTRFVEHNRFVLPIELDAGERLNVMVKYSSRGSGFVFPSMRVWNPRTLMAAHDAETSGMSFLFGGFFLMSMLAIVSGLASGERVFLAYGIYSFSKITVWATILGYTHQYFLRDDFHWNLMSISAAVSILCGLIFSRMFLRTKTHTPKMDWVLKVMMLNAVVLLISAMMELKLLAHVSITLALLLYPMLIVISAMRWRQGSKEAGVFALAWSVLVFALVIQAMRDLGVVEHNYLNYFGPPVASFVEMVAIMFALALRVRRLRQDKVKAEKNYTMHLERSKEELERLVQERTQELERAKKIAETEASTDYLTGIHNRRSFLLESSKRLKLCLRKGQPVSLLMFDLDHFKDINDRYGHTAGDQALKQFSQRIGKSIRETDVFGRLGGEEFALLICEAPHEAKLTAERLRDEIEKMKIDKPDGQLRLTASIGVTHSSPDTDIETMLHDADQALYQAKHKGRNQVAFHV